MMMLHCIEFQERHFVRKDTLSGKEGRRELTSERRTQIECELEILLSLRENDKSHLPNALRFLD